MDVYPLDRVLVGYPVAGTSCLAMAALITAICADVRADRDARYVKAHYAKKGAAR